MKKTFKILAVVLCAALLMGIGAMVTFALLQDSDEAVNVMTLGNVYIKQIEQERDGNGELVDFTQEKPLYPAWYEGTSIPYADASKWPGDGTEAWKVVEDNENVIDKFVTVTNTGKSDAYVRTIIAFEGDPISGPDIHVVHNDNHSANADVAAEFAEVEYIENVMINNVRYDVIVYTYANPLKPGETTIPSLKQVYLDVTTGNEVVEGFGDTYDVLVVSQAVQTKGFDSAIDALNAGFGVIDANNMPDFPTEVVPESDWTEKADTTWYDASATEYTLSTAADLAGLAELVNSGNSMSGKTFKLDADISLLGKEWIPIGQTGTSYGATGYFQGNFDGQGHTISGLTITQTNEGEDYAAGFFGFLDCGQTGTIKNVTFSGAKVSGHHWTGVAAGFLSGNMENVKVINSTVTCTHANAEACGDKAGAVVGYINGTQGKMTNCSAVECTVTAGRDAGQVVGCAPASQVVGCTATNVTVTATGDCNREGNINQDIIGRVN